ncbi:Arginase [Sporomusa ovata DSM 2662]|uniref:Arginase n=1 Tax=Sporomusa ovata TaxID=2378 RepID=A0A0U1L1R0_9FIRM|nr:arginase [Sporomusa ovata]EQB25067.1 arginase [Sporomusa ovata DSM 2662]CQR73616.1 Arginase [Sporomusa ovata]
MNPTINNRISIIGVPLDLGADRRGVDMGPSAIRYAKVGEKLQSLGYEIDDKGDIVANRPDSCYVDGTSLKYLDEIERVNTELCRMVAEEMAKTHFPLILGGDHSIAIGTISGVLQHKKKLGVLWFDAHGDINTAVTSPSGNIHGMPVAVCFGRGHERLTGVGGRAAKLDPGKFVMIGIRDLDPGEKMLLKELGVVVYTMHEIDIMGMAKVMEAAIKIVANGTDGVHVSFDMDVIDPLHAPGVGTPVLGGLTYRESHLAMELISAANIVTSAEFVEVNTILDNRNQTAKVAVDLMGSLLGERVL